MGKGIRLWRLSRPTNNLARSWFVRTSRFSTATAVHCAKSEAAGALDGIKILDLTRALAGPYCTQILADYGAEVIKVEQPGKGDDSRHWKTVAEMEKWNTPQGMSFYFASTNRNKRSITIDLKKDEGKQIIHDLIKRSDIMINNFIPGKMEELGIGYAVASKLNPSLIFASISGYGPTGPFARRAGYDLIAAAETGLLHITGEPDGPPTKPGVSMIDMCTGLYMHGAILAALESRHRTGNGQSVDASLFETQISMLVNVASTFLNTGQEGKRWGTGHPTIAPYSAFPTKDSYIVVGAVNDRQFESLMTHLGNPDLCKDGRFSNNASRVQNRAELKEILDGLFRRKTTREWLSVFDGTGMPYAPINNIEEAFKHPQIEARQMIETMRTDATTDGVVRVAGVPVKFGETPSSIRRSAPLLGEHTEEVLREIGMSNETIAKLRSEGVL